MEFEKIDSNTIKVTYDRKETIIEDRATLEAQKKEFESRLNDINLILEKLNK